MKTILLLIQIFLVAAILPSQAQDERKLAPFDAVSVTGNIEVILKKGTEEKAVIETWGIDEDDVNVFVKKDVLKLQLLKSIFDRDEKVTIRITYTNLRAIKANAGARLYSDEPITGDKLAVKATSGAVVDLDLDLNALDASVTEGGILKLAGSVNNQTVSAGTGGQYNGIDLECTRTYVRASTGGQATVVATESIDASANTGGSIEYRGNPDERSTKTLLAGEIRRL
ncbi:MAG: hypothetical protein DHS20C18_11450 [Saprospiraceae bacterium]|nr:MAG: hypothetical protein DHS20C18_11450 [Saprospiraceae bacterium]